MTSSAADFMRQSSVRRQSGDADPRAVTEHMPFAGHRTQETIRLRREAAMRNFSSKQALELAMEYGFDPDQAYG